MADGATTTIETSAPRSRGRAARLVQRGMAQPRRPYISRRIGTFNILDEEGLSLIEANADRLLQEIGMEFHDDAEILDIFRKAGADVRGTRVRFEPGMCRKIIRATAPAQFRQHARNLANTVVIGGTILFCARPGDRLSYTISTAAGATRRSATSAIW